MSNLFARHPEQDMVRYLDGELSVREASKFEQHLAQCPGCRTQVQDLKDTFADCARLTAQLPAAPAEWRDLYRDFSRIDEALANDSLLVRLMRPLVHSGAPRWSFVVGLAGLVVLLLVNQFRQAPSVQAASYLRQAVAISQSKPRPAHRIRVRTSRQEFTRSAVRQASLIEAAQVQAVAARFEAAHFDWDDPLSARSFEQWRDSQVQKTDEVNHPSEQTTQIRTVAAQGEVAAASITFDPEKYPVAERLEFRDSEWVELSETAETSVESAGTSVANHLEVPTRAAETPSRPAAFLPGPSASISDELQVLSDLSAIGADLGDPVEVTLSGGKVRVVGDDGIPARRQSEIRNAVANVPNVEVAFAPTAPALTRPESSAPTSNVTSAPVSPMQSKLEKHFGGRAAFDKFSTHLLDLMDEAAMPHVYPLHQLAGKFSSREEAQLSAKDIAILHDLSRKHTAEFAQKLGEMELLLKPVLTSLGGTPAGVPAVAHSAWQPAAEDVYAGAMRVDRLVNQMLGTSSSDVAANALPSQLLTALKELRGNLDDCQKLLAAR